LSCSRNIFPQINIPVVSVICQHTGLSEPEMEQRVTTYGQYAISTRVTRVANMEVQTLNGASVQNSYFQPDVSLDIVSTTNTIRTVMPPGIQAPIVVSYNSSSVSVLQLTLKSDRVSEQQLSDDGLYDLRQQLARCMASPFPTPRTCPCRRISPRYAINNTRCAPTQRASIADLNGRAPGQSCRHP
jgi:multidrug efflux pump subunit AcrB